MIDDKYLTYAADKLMPIYEAFQTDVLIDIVERLLIADFFIPRSQWQIYVLQQAGMQLEEINKRIRKLTGKSEREVEQLFHDAAITALEYDDKVYEQAGLKPLPFQQSKRLVDVLKASVRQTNGELYNLTRTTATTSQRAFINSLDNAYYKIASGAVSYSAAVIDAVDELARNNVAKVLYPSGQTRSIESAARTAVVTGINQMTTRITFARMQEMGWEHVVVSSHYNARTTGTGHQNHYLWQGKVYHVNFDTLGETYGIS